MVMSENILRQWQEGVSSFYAPTNTSILSKTSGVDGHLHSDLGHILTSYGYISSRKLEVNCT